MELRVLGLMMLSPGAAPAGRAGPLPVPVLQEPPAQKVCVSARGSVCACPRQVAEDEVSDNSAECVVCLSDVRDTLILPCRHLCLCNTCADTLRYQANNCPICRLREPPLCPRVRVRTPGEQGDGFCPSPPPMT